MTDTDTIREAQARAIAEARVRQLDASEEEMAELLTDDAFMRLLELAEPLTPATFALMLHDLNGELARLIAEVAELRRILYAAIDPESGARSAQDVRDLVQGELNTVAGSNPAPVRGSSGPASSTGTAEHGLAGERGDGCCVRSRPAISSPIATTRKEVNEREADGCVDEPSNPARVETPAPVDVRTTPDSSRSLTSFGADDWATVDEKQAFERGFEQLRWMAQWVGWPRKRYGSDRPPEFLEPIQPDEAAALLAYLARLRAADQAKTEALHEAREYVCEWPIGTSDDPQEQRGGPRDTMIRNIDAALAAAAAAPKETT